MTLKNFFLRHFPTPKFLAMPSVGIDISPLCIRIMEIPMCRTLKVGIYEQRKLTAPFSIANPSDEVKAILKEWKAKYKLHYIKSSIPEEKAYLFEKEMDFGTDDKMRTEIEFILEENVPISGAESIFDYRISGAADKQKEKAKVAVTVLPSEVVKKYIALFNECGLTPISFMIEPQALSRAVIKRGDQGTYLIVNINDSKTGLFVVSRGSVQFTSTLALGSDDFTRAIQSKHSVSAEEAEKLKMEKGFSKTAENIVLDNLVGVASMLRVEIEKVSVYWHGVQTKETAPENIQKIIFSGTEAALPGFKEYFSQNIKMPVEIGNVWSNLGSFDKYVPPITFNESLGYGLAIGLALPENE